jgi:hypothetical protein
MYSIENRGMRGACASVAGAGDVGSPEPGSPARKLLAPKAVIATRLSQQLQSQNDCFM